MIAALAASGRVNLRLRSESVCAMSVDPSGMRAAVLAGTVLLSACTTVGPDFKRPQVPWLDAWTDVGPCPKDMLRVLEDPETTEPH